MTYECSLYIYTLFKFYFLKELKISHSWAEEKKKKTLNEEN